MTTVSLIKYDEARKALAVARSIDEVKSIKNLSEQQKLYAKQAKDTQLLADSTEIRERAVRRLGQLIEAQKKTVGLDKGGRPEKTGFTKNPVKLNGKPTLAGAGIDKNLAHQARASAKLSDSKFEKAVAEKREAIESRASRPLNSPLPKRRNKSGSATNVGAESEPGIEAEIDGEDPENYRTAYLLRVDQAVRFAAYSGAIDREIITAARKVATVWNNLAKTLEQRL